MDVLGVGGGWVGGSWGQQALWLVLLGPFRPFVGAGPQADGPAPFLSATSVRLGRSDVFFPPSSCCAASLDSLPVRCVICLTARLFAAISSMGDARNKYLSTKIADGLGVGEAAVVAFLRDQCSEMLAQFYRADGPPRLLFLLAEPSDGASNGSGGSNNSTAPPSPDSSPSAGGAAPPRDTSVVSTCLASGAIIYASSGDLSGAFIPDGCCVYFIRTGNRALSASSIDQDVVCGSMDQHLIRDLRLQLREVLIPALRAQTAWGELTKEDGVTNESEIRQFLDSAEKFLISVSETEGALRNNVRLAPPIKAFHIKYTPEAMKAASQKLEIVLLYEETLRRWNDQIIALVQESSQVRSEDEETGPRAELEYWKSRMARFNSIVEQLKTTDSKTVLGVLKFATSPVLDNFAAIDRQVTDCANEAKDNVKYLYTLDEFAEPLYRGDPTVIAPSIPALINAVRTMYGISRFYNTSERMTSLFVKFTNQMILTCKQYLRTDSNIFDENRTVFVGKLRACIELNEVYQQCFREVKFQLQEDPAARQFDFSESAIFSKFDQFCERLEKIVSICRTMEQFSSLETCKIDNIGPLVSRFKGIVQDLKRKPQTFFLDHRKNDFDKHYLEFNKNVLELEADLVTFINETFLRSHSTARSISLLRQFQTVLQRESLQKLLDEKYRFIFESFGKDLDYVRNVYERFKEEPPLSRNMPQVAGSIAWARQLLRRIEGPMEFFERTSVMQLPDSKKIVKLYNKVATTLVAFESLWFDVWCQSVDAARDGLHATLLVRHPATGQLFINFDQEILQLLREAKCLQRLGFQLPDSAMAVFNQGDKFKSVCEVLSDFLTRFASTRESMNPAVKALLAPYVHRIGAKIEPGLVSITWTSVTVISYVASLQSIYAEFTEVLDKVNDIFGSRIDGNREYIRNRVRLVQLSGAGSGEESLMSLAAFVERQAEITVEAAREMDSRSREIEQACHDLVDFVKKAYSTDEIDQIGMAIREFVAAEEKKTYAAASFAIRASVQQLKHRVSLFEGPEYLRPLPVFKADVSFRMPVVVLEPGLDEVQKAVFQIAKSMAQGMREVQQWQSVSSSRAGKPQQETGKADSRSDLFLLVGSSKAVVKTFLQLSGAIDSLKKETTRYLATFHDLLPLWTVNRKDQVAVLSQKHATLEDYEIELRRYAAYGHRTEEFPEQHQLGPMALDFAPLATAVKNEALQWKLAYGAALNDKVKGDIRDLSAFIEETSAKLSRKVKDLEDVNQIMATLSKLREMEAEIEMKLVPIEETYAVLNRYHVPVNQEEQDQVDTIRYGWKKLVSQARETMDRMREIAPGYKKQLTNDAQVFAEDLSVFNTEYTERGPGVQGVKPRVAVDRLKSFQSQYEERERKMLSYQMGEQLFGLPQTDYPDLVRIGKELKLLAKLYDLYQDVLFTISGYDDVLWTEMDIESMTNQITEFGNKCRKMPKGLRDWDAYNELKQMIDDFNETLPLLQGLAGPAMRDRHWEQVSELCQVKLEYASPDFKVKSLVEANLLKFKDEIEEITSGAVKEADIEVKLNKIRDDWVPQDLHLGPFKNRGDLVLRPSDTSELLTLIEDTQMTLGSLMSNRYNRAFRKDIQSWVQKLATVQEALELWLQVQALWIYLEAVFSGGDIARQLPQEAKRFSNIDKSWCKIMASAAENSNVIKFCFGDETLRQTLPHLLESLEICQKSLSGYLEAKRQVFPRFYFVSDTQLLEILGQGSDPHTIQPHLLSIFANIGRVEFDKTQRTRIVAMESAEGEKVSLYEPLPAEGNIEDWLNKLVAAMSKTVKEVCRDMTRRLDMVAEGDRQKSEEFIRTFPAQVSLLGIQIMWTVESEDALEKAKTEKSSMQVARKKFEQLLSTLIDITTIDLDKRMRTNIETLITIHIHQVDIFQALVKQRVRAANDFEWLKQTRFYWKAEEDRCVISICDVDFDYCWEFLGCRERLVITPLTDRIYISCSQAMGMYYGGAPAGPAGTGKTETTKDMGSTCGKYFITINCSDQMDYRGMAKLYKGIAQSGLWCGFDEINRVELEVLSVVAAQIACIYAALRDRKNIFTFVDGTDIPLDHKCGIFITMNPGYAGRTELPENMKALFRSIAVVVPDRQIIMRVRLAASGFQENQPLAKKFFILYRLCEEQLSKQTHYDFGLRNILSVLRTCGTTKRANPASNETMVLMRVLRDMNISKLVEDDEPLFLSLLSDLFPGVQVESGAYPDLQASIAKHAEAMGLVNSPGWNTKIIQLYEQWRVRHGLCIMGPSGAGKSAVIAVLAKALSDVDVPVKETRMNPKAITATQMFGRLDVQTNDWTDGIFSSLWRRASKRTQGNSWIVLDGPVDAVWIENLNTVLDDTRTLTLANGDRLGMPASLKLLFEVGNLDNASPATVSRMGMMYMGPGALGWEPVVEAWIKASGRSEDEKQKLRDLYAKSIEALFSLVRDNCEPRMNLEPVNYVATSLTLLRGLLPYDDDGKARKVSLDHVERLFAFAMAWSLGGLLESNDRVKFHSFLARTGIDVPKTTSEESSIYEYLVEDSGAWKHWNERVPLWEYPKDSTPDFASILVPTVDNVRTDYLISIVAKQGKPVLLIGESGTAKTVTIQQYLGHQDAEAVKNKMIAFSSATSPMIFQRTVETMVEKRMGTSYGPPPGKRLIVFIDDVNMPEINTWGDQITNEIVRQLVEDGGFYSLDRPGDWTSIVDVSFLAAMQQPGGGRNDVPSRLKRHFSIFNVTLPSTQSVEKIYGTISRGHFCLERGFSAEVCESAKLLPGVTRTLWDRTKAKMLPTPNKFHYIFNLRDLSRIFQGLLKAETEIIRTRIDLLSLWRHEAERVIPDRFNDPADLEWYAQFTEQLLTRELGGDVAVVQEVMKPRYFADFLRDEVESEDPDKESFVPKIYEQIPNWTALQERLEYYLGQYNEFYKKAQMDLVLFEFAMTHLLRISRIIRTARGNALLVGVGGSGKQSLTRLASFIAGYKTFQITITKNYNTTNLLEDLKSLYRIAALESPVVFLFTDNEIKEEGFLEYINMILTSGEVGGLFQKDEIDAIMEDLRVVAKKEIPGFLDTSENLYKYFISRVRDRLHVVLCFSPVGDKFRTRARKFPGLISGCSIDWFPPWPVDALHATAMRFLGEFPMVVADDVRSSLFSHVCAVHDLVNSATFEYFNKFRRNVYVTPKSYLSFIDVYKKTYTRKHEEVKVLADRISAGLSKLLQAEKDVGKMKIALIQKEKDLAVAVANTEKLLAEIKEQTTIAEAKKNEVQAVKDVLQVQADQINAEKVQAEGELEAAKPALEEAESALNQIKPADIATLKKLGKPPNLIKRIMDGVLLLRLFSVDRVQVDPEFTDRQQILPSWGEAVKMMSDSSFLSALMNFEKDNINDETCELVMPYLEMEDFTTDLARKSSGNAAGLCTWVRAMVTYHNIAKVVAPKRERLREAEIALRSAMKELSAAQAELDEKQRQVDEMMAKLDAAMKEKQRLQDDAVLTKNRLVAAEALIAGLTGEKARWTQQSKEFDETIRRLVGDVAVACAFLSYCGPFNQEYRNILITKKWVPDLVARKIPITQDTDNQSVISFLTDENTVGEWNLQGLPTDELSVQNGIIVTTASRYPLLVDPQGQGKRWIKNREEKSGLQVTNLNHKMFRQHLEDCLSQGRPLLIEDLGEELDPVLDPLLEKNFIKSGRKFKVRVGDKEIDIENGFMLYMTTKLPNPRYIPEVFAKSSIIDFTVTRKGLEDQLLGRVILKEKAELEESRKQLLEEINMCKKTVSKCEEDLLFRLSSSQGNLLDDSSLIDVLNQTKKISQEVKEKLSIAESTTEKITAAREDFRPVATRGSILYFVITELSLVNVMYQISLEQFLQLFDLAIDTAATNPVQSKRIQNIIDNSTRRIYLFVQRGLYEKDKMMYSLLLTLKIDMNAGTVSSSEFNTLLRGGAAVDMNTARKKPFGWIPDNSWLNLIALSTGVSHKFASLLEHIMSNEAAWRAFYDAEKPEAVTLPDGYEGKLSKFHKFLLVRSWREDRTLSSATEYIMESLGQLYVESIPLDWDATWGETSFKVPIIALLSQGSDPSSSIEALAKKKKTDIKMVSMGQGQEIIARRLVQNGMTNGGWVLLQNCHLGIKYLMELEELLSTTDESTVEPTFRIWITTEPTMRFPINLLQMGIKLTNEPPQGVRASLRRSYAWINQDMIDAVDKQQWRPMLYAVCFLHCTVIERKKFGPLGWCVPYEFNQTDLAASVQFLQNHLYNMLDPKKGGGVSWTTVRYMVCEVQYGGRITDDYDKRLLVTYGDLWFSPNMFQETFEFYKNYKIPDFKTVNEYRAYVDQLPLIDTPEIFGMHPNAELTFNANKAREVLGTILDVQPKDSGGSGGETREDAVLRIANDLLSKLPVDYVKVQVRGQIKKQGGFNPLNVFLSQEVDRMQILIGLIRRTLQDLKLAIAGTIIMSSDLQDALNYLFDARVPPKWLKVSWDSPTLGYWFSDVLGRVRQFTAWLNEGRPKAYWLTGFFNPQGFLTAMKQESTRKHQGWSLDGVVLKNEVLKEDLEAMKGGPEDGVYIYGLFLEGAAWDRKNGKLVDSQPKVLFVAMPVIHVMAVNAAPSMDSRTYVCPVYRLPRRTALNYVFDITLKSDESPDRWTLKGVAALCSKY